MKRILLLTAAVIMVMGLQAKQVEVNKAKSIAQQFLLGKSSNSTTRTAVSNDGLDLVYTATASNGEHATRAASVDGNLFYVFSQSDSKGFVIVAADDAVSPILAYSHENGFNGDNIPCNVKAVLDNYRAASLEAIANGKDASAEWSNVATRAAEEEAVDGEYLLKSKWGQDWPYNAQTPKLADEHCMTGCVATAMAQIMYYWKYPNKGNGTNEYYWDNGEKTLFADFSESFDWDSMHDEYSSVQSYSQEEIDAIGLLMKQCGHSVNMSYETNESSGSFHAIPMSLSKYFDYNKYTYKMDSFSDGQQVKDNWLKNIKNEIDNEHPVVYGSYSHAYICDGYKDDYLHLNFGWGGYYDGFYKFMSSNSFPETYLNYDSQYVIYGIMPATQGPSSIADVEDIEFRSPKFTNVLSTDKEIRSGQNIGFYISFETNTTTQITDELAIVEVNNDYDVLSVLGTAKVKIDEPFYYNGAELYSKYITHFNTVYGINVYNKGNENKVIKVMPAYKKGDAWVVLKEASPIEFVVKPVSTERATALTAYFDDEEKKFRVNIAKETTLLSRVKDDFRNDPYFHGKVNFKITNAEGNIIDEWEKDATMNASDWCRLTFGYTFKESGTYTLHITALDENGKETSIDTQTITFTCNEEPDEPYIMDFGFIENNTEETSFNNNAYWAFKEGSPISIGGRYKNPTDEEAEKTLILINNKDEVIAETKIKIPSHGISEFNYEIKAVKNEEDEMNDVYIYIKEKNESGGYLSPAQNEAQEKIHLYLHYNCQVPSLFFTSRPSSLDYGEDELLLYANQSQLLFFQIDQFKSTISANRGYTLVARLYDGETLVAGSKGNLPGAYGSFCLRMNGFDVTPGSYTLRFFLLQKNGCEFDVFDTDGNPVTYNVIINGRDLLPTQSYILNNGEDFLFSANSQKLYRGETSNLRFSLKNPHAEDFNGYIKVACDLSVIQSDEKQITIKSNEAESVYGEISVKIPDTYENNIANLLLYAKSQYDDDYREIKNSSVLLDVLYSSGINSVTTYGGATILDGKITLGEGKTVNSAVVYDVAGRSIGGYTISGNTIDLQSLPQGIYMVEINTGDNAPIKLKVHR